MRTLLRDFHLGRDDDGIVERPRRQARSGVCVLPRLRPVQFQDQVREAVDSVTAL